MTLNDCQAIANKHMVSYYPNMILFSKNVPLLVAVTVLLYLQYKRNLIL